MRTAVRTPGRTAGRFAVMAAVVLAVGAGCSDDGDDDAAPADPAPSTTAVDDASSTTADASSDPADVAGAGIGTVTVDGEARTLDTITGILSCQEQDDGSFSLAAESDTPTSEGGTFLRFDVYGDDPDSNELSVAAGETEYVSESPSAIDYSIDGDVVTGSADVVPLFEEGTAQSVTFEVDCGAA